MKKHQMTFGDTVQGRCKFAGIKDAKTLAKKIGVNERTISRHLQDGAWSREQVQEMHRFLHFTAEDMAIYFEGR